MTFELFDHNYGSDRPELVFSPCRPSSKTTLCQPGWRGACGGGGVCRGCIMELRRILEKKFQDYNASQLHTKEMLIIVRDGKVSATCRSQNGTRETRIITTHNSQHTCWRRPDWVWYHASMTLDTVERMLATTAPPPQHRLGLSSPQSGNQPHDSLIGRRGDHKHTLSKHWFSSLLKFEPL